MAVADSSVIVPLLRIGKLELLKSYFGKIQIPQEVQNEIIVGQIGVSVFADACKKWVNVSLKEFPEAENIAKREGISTTDATLILLAEERKDILVSNDAALILIAKSRGIKCLWLTAMLLKCVKKQLISKKEAKGVLLQLVQAGMHLSNGVYSAILSEIDKM